MALKLNASAVFSLQNLPLRCRTQSGILSIKPNQSGILSIKPNQSGILSIKPNRICQDTPKMFCSMNMAANQPDDPRKLSFAHIVDKARSLYDSFPPPVKSFPWNKTLENFIQLILDVGLAVIKYLSVPLFVVTSISEMSYCAHERKLYLIALPFLVGVAVAGVLRDAALEASSYLKYAEVPWHLIAILIFFALLKLPGPYYPYWGRIFIPHFANGALWRTLWFMFLWYRRPQKTAINLPGAVNNPKTDTA
ncbi:hypothetical protein CDL12_19145 [Handroanthus impetiginosus]|uniref:Uncharacterized protein n=1 Tax=Handroanthus impetiginosus TaxID=429701 RepID=A0A2G9GSU6_9LAMI|nr:hypothetical protein CDL12_19145 [Handroanthus impetiginosus]